MDAPRIKITVTEQGFTNCRLTDYVVYYPNKLTIQVTYDHSKPHEPLRIVIISCVSDDGPTNLYDEIRYEEHLDGYVLCDHYYNYNKIGNIEGDFYNSDGYIPSIAELLRPENTRLIAENNLDISRLRDFNYLNLLYDIIDDDHAFTHTRMQANLNSSKFRRTLCI